MFSLNLVCLLINCHLSSKLYNIISDCFHLFSEYKWYLKATQDNISLHSLIIIVF